MPNGEFWNTADECALWAAFRKEIKAELDARNAARGVPNGTRLPMGDPRAFLRWDGDELSNRFEQRKIDFCAAPRDPKTELEKYGLTPAFVVPERPPVINPALRGVVADGVRDGMQPFVEAMQELVQSMGGAKPLNLKASGRLSESELDNGRSKHGDRGRET